MFCEYRTVTASRASNGANPAAPDQGTEAGVHGVDRVGLLAELPGVQFKRKNFAPQSGLEPVPSYVRSFETYKLINL